MNGGWILDFLVSRYGAGALNIWIVVDAVFRSFAKKRASVLLEMAHKIVPLHRSRHGNANLLSRHSGSRPRLLSEFRVRFEKDLNRIAQVFPRFFQRFPLCDGSR